MFLDWRYKSEFKTWLKKKSAELSKKDIVLQTIDLKKQYGRGNTSFLALRGVSIVLRKGELVSIVGPSGSGKSTLLNLLGALDRPTSGKVLIDGVDISRLGDDKLAYLRNKKIGFVFQSFNLIQRMSALDNVMMPLLVRKMSSKNRRISAVKILNAVGLENKLHRKPTELSGGEQQRVAVARAFVTNPSIILGDEITGNLDTTTTAEIVSLVKDLNAKLDTTFIIVTHNMEVANETNRIIRVRDGMIEKDQKIQLKKRG